MEISKSLIIALFFLQMNTYAQENEWPTKGDSEIGAILGLNFSTFYGGDVDGDELDYLAGMLLGVSYDYYFSQTWSIKGILNYDQKGSKGDFNAKLRANYITIPINANWHFGKRKRWYLNFGPYFGILLSASVDGDDIKDSFKSSAFGFNTGIGVKIPIGGNMFFIESSGQSGFGTVDSSGIDDIKNSRGNLAIGIFF